jgi:hypothetical protein
MTDGSVSTPFEILVQQGVAPCDTWEGGDSTSLLWTTLGRQPSHMIVEPTGVGQPGSLPGERSYLVQPSSIYAAISLFPDGTP